ncbi:unnamed protein product [Urochloa humidicola]
MTRKRRNRSRICDEVFLLVFSRLPARDAVRCVALSRHHRRLVGSLDFWLLHHRLAPPVTHPHLAYMASSNLPGRLFHEFHHLVAGSDNDDSLRRALIDRDPARSCRQRYAGTCNGVVVLAAERFYPASTTVVLFNPAVAGSEEVFGINLNNTFGLGPYRVSGFGYGASTGRHRLLVTRVHEKGRSRNFNGADLLSYTLGRGGEGHRCRAVLSLPKSGTRTKISGSSVYLDGKVYLLADHARVLVFDVDDESVTAIELPGERVPEPEEKHARSKLMEMSGRLCVATAGGEGSSIALWPLTADQQWERRCLIPRYAPGKLAGGWDCGGALLLLFKGLQRKESTDLMLYDTRVGNNKACETLRVPRAVAESTEEEREGRHVFCWGYRPTIVTPGSILSGGGMRPLLRRGGGVAAALNPVLERDVRAGRRWTMETRGGPSLVQGYSTEYPLFLLKD